MCFFYFFLPQIHEGTKLHQKISFVIIRVLEPLWERTFISDLLKSSQQRFSVCFPMLS